MAKTKKASLVSFDHNADWDRWRGSVDSKLESISTNLVRLEETISNGLVRLDDSATQLVHRLESQLHGRHSVVETRLQKVETVSTVLRVKVAVISALAGLAGGGIATAIFQYITKHVLLN